MSLFVFIFLVLSTHLEQIVGHNPLFVVAPHAVLLLGIIQNGFFERGKLYIGLHWNKQNVSLYFLYFALVVLSMLRISSVSGGAADNLSATISGLSRVIQYNIFLYLFFSHQYRNGENFSKISQQLFQIVLLAVVLDVLFYTVLYVGKHDSAPTFGEGDNVLLGAMGVHIEKKNLPYTGAHPNVVGIYAGALIVVCILALITTKGKGWFRKFLFFSLFVCGLFVVMADSRGTVINIFLATGAVLLFRWLRILSQLRWIVILSPLLPFLMLLFLKTFADSSVLNSVSRNEGELESGNSRGMIWDYCVAELMEPKPQHFIGYGINGQYGAGVSPKYSRFFGEGGAANEVVTHNYFLQSLFDIGYIGTFIMLYVIVLGFNNLVFLHKRGSRFALPLLGFFTYYMLSGTSESSIGLYFPTYYMIATMFLLFIFITKDESVHRDQMAAAAKPRRTSTLYV